jgi:hypothetical protein
MRAGCVCRTGGHRQATKNASITINFQVTALLRLDSIQPFVSATEFSVHLGAGLNLGPPDTDK